MSWSGYWQRRGNGVPSRKGRGKMRKELHLQGTNSLGLVFEFPMKSVVSGIELSRTLQRNEYYPTYLLP